MNSEDTNQSCNKFSILGEPEAVSPVGKKGGRGADYTAPGSPSLQFFMTF